MASLLLLFYFTYAAGWIQEPPSIEVDQERLIFSSVEGTTSSTHVLTLTNSGTRIQVLEALTIVGPDSLAFKVVTPPLPAVEPDRPVLVALSFSPPVGAKRILAATLHIRVLRADEPVLVPLRGLSQEGLDPASEPALADVARVFDFSVEVGWSEGAYRTTAAPAGAEVPVALFRRAGEGPVEWRPVARFSEDGPAAFGYYAVSDSLPVLHEVGILSASGHRNEHQTVYPRLETGAVSFDYGTEPFGLYVSDTLETIYSEDWWNVRSDPDRAGHRVRCYPLSDGTGRPVDGTYLLGFDGDGDGDYQDHVFVISNVRPVDDPARPHRLFNEQDLTGWYMFLPSSGTDSDPDSVFRVRDGALLISGREDGYLMTEEDFEDYHLTLQFRGAQEQVPPLEDRPQASGLRHHVPPDSTDRIWPGGIAFPLQDGSDGADRPSDGPRIDWVTLEVVARDGRWTHLINGVVVEEGTGTGVRTGRLLLQSGGSGVRVRNLFIRRF